MLISLNVKTTPPSCLLGYTVFFPRFAANAYPVVSYAR
jgi:hypothetical protein